MPPTRRAGVVLLSLGLAFSLAACGGSSSGDAAGASSTTSAADTETPAADALFAQMKSSATAATSGRFAGSLVLDAKPTTVDLKGNRDGSNQAMTMSVSGQGNATILTVDGKEYVKADRAFWESQGGGDVADIAGDKFIETGEAAAGEVSFGKVLDEMFSTEFSTIDKVNTKVEKVDLDGAPAYLMTQRIGDDDTKLWVSADGQAHLLKISGTDAEGPLSLTFSEWNSVAPVTAPPADQLAIR